MSSSSSTLPQYKQDFMKTAIDSEILKFGSFTLKSGRTSPYFFNCGLFYTADLLRAISTAFAKTIIASPSLEFDIIFGPAYKGIPLATSTCDKLAELAPERYGKLCYSFDRKEAKDHGEGGNIVGAPLKGKKVLIVDDVVTAGTAKREAIAKIEKEGGIVAGILVALDRMETLPTTEGEEGKGGPSAIGEIRREYGVPVLAILTLEDIIGGLRESGREEEVKGMEAYRAKYKASD
ncbi:hypothetical protein LZ554_001877 [Drepanopeziza brunnea f. sp. 'monogermtubi']|nr:hypothetical protein LZ554_001877 [Drepanopeziza brunnea f. sp. 'monogermtubi']